MLYPCSFLVLARVFRFFSTVALPVFFAYLFTVHTTTCRRPVSPMNPTGYHSLHDQPCYRLSCCRCGFGKSELDINILHVLCCTVATLESERDMYVYEFLDVCGYATARCW
ncbi:hypothetical protein B0H34DRAFT_18763 [Crassisporium funariophilum]|nr:hypothetical protein B0H34DRAFT_18763 [Crassisporium funariophilum]